MLLLRLLLPGIPLKLLVVLFIQMTLGFVPSTGAAYGGYAGNNAPLTGASGEAGSTDSSTAYRAASA